MSLGGATYAHAQFYMKLADRTGERHERGTAHRSRGDERGQNDAWVPFTHARPNWQERPSQESPKGRPVAFLAGTARTPTARTPLQHGMMTIARNAIAVSSQVLVRVATRFLALE
jgi:hypothetical protein